MAANPGSDHWRKLEELFYAALDLAPSERPSFLDHSCEADSALRREVEILLNSSDKTWGFFQKPLQAAAEQVTAGSDFFGQRIGDYKVIRLMGEGGMGKVYLAARADELYQQQVAIKLVQGGTGRTRDLLLRFSAERQILANLAHPNIARLLDAGIATHGSPYLVMEYIEGEAIDKYVAAGALSIRDRLELFRTVCAAVEYAHRNLVVHRDIKPANILVTREGVPKLLDFGIAKLLQSSNDSGDGAGAALTRATERLMTPEYASPEQARGQVITTATDVYALGGLLYALLTGRPPFELASRDPLEVAQIICERPPTRPSSADHDHAALPRGEDAKLKGDLDNIVLKALRKEPELRYPTVAEFSEDVRRYLEGYPLQAGSNAWGYRATKFVRRHKGAVAAAVLMAFAIIGFSIGMGVLAQRARRERNKAEQEQLKSEQEAKFLSGLFKASTPDVERGKTITARDVLDLGAQRIDRELSGQPEVRAAMLDNIGMSYYALGLYDQARPLVEQAYSLRKQTLGQSNLTLAESSEHLGEVLRIQGKYADAEPLLRQALAVRQRSLGDKDKLVGESLTDLGEVLSLQSKSKEAETVLRNAIAIAAPDTDVAADARDYLALVVEPEGRYDEAIQLLRSSSGILARNKGTDSPDYLISMHNLAGALMDIGNLSEGEVIERQVLATRQRVSGAEHPDTTYSLNNLGWVLLEKGDWAAAEPYLKQNLEANRKRLGEKHPRMATALNNWARVLQEKGDYADAEKFYQQALTISRETGGAQSRSAAKIEANIGFLRLDRGDYAGAEKYSREALELRRKLGGDENPDVASSLIDVGVIRSFRGDLPGAEALLRQALDVRKKILAPGHMRIISTQVRLGEVLTAEGKFSEAEPILREAVKSAQNSPFPLVPWQVAEAETALGVCMAGMNQTAEARSLIQKSDYALKTYPEAALRKQALRRAASVMTGEKP